MDFQVQLTSNEVERTKNKGVIVQNETVDELSKGDILHNET